MLKVKQVMSKPVITITPETLVKDATALLATRNVSGAPVVEGEKIVGVFSEADVLRSLKTMKKEMRLVFPSISSLGIAFQEEVTQREIIEAYEEIGNTQVKDVMSKEVVTVDADIPLNDAIAKMVQRGISRLPVIEDKKLVGIVTRGDIIRGLAMDKGNGGH
ncbi:MAG: CBS domain-containing protein [Thermoplasmata archaeon]|jgi:CBS domain-containing protein|nr:CBS domain-containing protein [Thermoplasmata archaeon]